MSKCPSAASLCCCFSYLLGSPLCFFLGIHHSCSNPNTPFPVYLPKSHYVQAVSLNSVQTRTPAFYLRVKHWQNSSAYGLRLASHHCFWGPSLSRGSQARQRKRANILKKHKYEGWLRSWQGHPMIVHCEAALYSTHISVCYMVLSGQDPDGLWVAIT